MNDQAQKNVQPRVILWTLPLAAIAWFGVSSSAAPPSAVQDDGYGGAPVRVIAWNDLGMHCIDPDFSVFSILPPFNTINAQVMQNGQLIDSLGTLEVTYESVADSTGSINTTSIGKTNFWQHVQSLFGQSPAPDVGLTGNAMPGVANDPQPMEFDSAFQWAQGEGIPLTPRDDAGKKQPYPLMKVTVRNSTGTVVASTITSVPNSQELLCSQCHASGSSPYARPALGWVNHPDPLKDDRLNILSLHDEKHSGESAYVDALAAHGYSEKGLFETVVTNGVSILCANCHGSNALPGTGLAGISPLTAALHGSHADVMTEQERALDEDQTRSACYTCHPGFDTQCLRGAMGTAIGHDGQFSMDCQSCHGGMSDVGDPNRVGWLDQQTCQNCHTGSATLNSGEIRYDSAFDAQGDPRVAASDLFATEDDVPQAGFSLYRLSKGHGGLQCSACHGPPHAIYPTSVDNDNEQSIALQGHDGTIMECSTCHGQLEDDELDQGPHGMHATSTKWVRDVHKDAAEDGLSDCQMCHGADNRGTVLSEAKTDRTYNTPLGTKTFFKGERISCYSCHDGPNDSDPSSNHRPVVPDQTHATPLDQPLSFALSGTDQDGDALTYRIVDQPTAGAFGRLSNGTVGLIGNVATFYPGEVQGSVTFTYAANDGDIDSNKGTITVNVQSRICEATVEDYGFGCSAANGIVPSLTLIGCPEPGEQVTLVVSPAIMKSHVFLVVGTSRDARELSEGCTLRVGDVIETIALPMTQGSNSRHGDTREIQYTIPVHASGTVNFQAFIRDPSPGYIGAFTNAVEVRFQ